MTSSELLEYIRSQKTIGNTDEEFTSSLLTKGWKTEDIADALNSIQQNPETVGDVIITSDSTVSSDDLKNFLVDRKPTILVKIYLYLTYFVGFGFLVFIFDWIIFNRNLQYPDTTIPEKILKMFLNVWSIVFAYMLPVGIIGVGLWSIVYKESLIKSPKSALSGIHERPIAMKGTPAVITGIFYLLLGMFLLWGINGIVLGIICHSSTSVMCTFLPKFIKFF